MLQNNDVVNTGLTKTSKSYALALEPVKPGNLAIVEEQIAALSRIIAVGFMEAWSPVSPVEISRDLQPITGDSCELI